MPHSGPVSYTHLDVYKRQQRHLMRRLGGLTGDTLGSLVEVTQAAFATVVALVAAPLLW